MPNFLAKELSPAKYRLLGLVGHGQFGRVYCAIHRKTGRLVALKELDRQRFSTQKFLRELRFLLSLQHKNIVTCQALEHTQARRYLVMDYCEGGTLRNLMNEDVQLHPLEGLRLISQILAGLEHAHERGIVHCDIKPENILLELTASGWRARITDFGIAQLSQSPEKEEFSNTGSPAYMAPERFYGQYFPSSDLYAVGILLYEMLVGHRPFSGLPAELMSAHLNQPVKVPDWIPIELKAVIVTALQKLPARRFRSATAMANRLKEAIAPLEQQLCQGWLASTVLRPVEAPHQSSFYAVYQTAVPELLRQLVSGINLPSCSSGQSSYSQQLENQQLEPDKSLLGFFQVCENQILYQTYDPSTESAGAKAVAGEDEAMAIVLPEPIVDLAVRPQGCFAITRQAVFFLPLRGGASLFAASTLQPSKFHSEDAAPTGNSGFAVVPELLVRFDQDVKVAIAPQGNWLAGITQTSAGQNQVQLWNLRNSESFQSDNLLSGNLQPKRVAIACQSHPSFQILALDNRHLATIAHCINLNEAEGITGTLVEVFTRRGNFLGSLKVSLTLEQVFSTPTPYRLLATESELSRSLLFFELKPFRLQRVGLPIVPHFVAATSWGYVLMENSGAMALIDHQGRMIGQMDGLEHPTAIAALDAHILVIATWHKGKGCLYLVDLRTLDLDFVF